MTARERLPNRRASTTLAFECAGRRSGKQAMSALAHGAAREPPINEIIGGDWWDARRGADRKRAAERQRGRSTRTPAPR